MEESKSKMEETEPTTEEPNQQGLTQKHFEDIITYISTGAQDPTYQDLETLYNHCLCGKDRREYQQRWIKVMRALVDMGASIGGMVGRLGQIGDVLDVLEVEVGRDVDG